MQQIRESRRSNSDESRRQRRSETLCSRSARRVGNILRINDVQQMRFHPSIIQTFSWVRRREIAGLTMINVTRSSGKFWDVQQYPCTLEADFTYSIGDRKEIGGRERNVTNPLFYSNWFYFCGVQNMFSVSRAQSLLQLTSSQHWDSLTFSLYKESWYKSRCAKNAKTLQDVSPLFTHSL